MTLPCLTCQTLQRTNSDAEDERSDPRLQRLRRARNERNWSGRLLPRSSDNAKKFISKHNRGSSTTAIMHNFEQAETPNKSEPRLVRSPGMRRDWSFEDLKKSSIACRA